jgi:hypothetical protein
MTLHALHQLHVLYYDFTFTLQIHSHGDYFLDVILQEIHPSYMKKEPPPFYEMGGGSF